MLTEDDVCSGGNQCAVSGAFIASSRWDYHVKENKGCIAIVAPPSLEAASRKLNARLVVVRGKSIRQPLPSIEMPNAYYYEVDGVRVNANFCRLAIIPESIESSDGELLWKTAQQKAQDTHETDNP